MSTTGLSIIIPAHNEQVNLKGLIKSIVWVFLDSQIPYEIIVVDDHSTDQTRRVIQACSKLYPVTYLANSGMAGKGYAVLAGFTSAIYEYVAVVDADAEPGVEYLQKLFELAKLHGFACARLRRSKFKRFLRAVRPCEGPKIFKREIFEFLDKNIVNSWYIDAPLIHTARELGFVGGYLDLGYQHLHRHKSLKSRLGRLVGNFQGYLKAKFNRQIFTYEPTNKESMLGAGVAHRGKRFVTHSTLPVELSALKTFAPWQVYLVLSLIIILAIGLVVSGRSTLIIVTATLSFIYLLDVIFNLVVTLKSLHFPPEIQISAETLNNLKDKNLPLYSVLCPLYKEARVLPQFVDSMSHLDWPKNKLEVLLLLEEDDVETIETASNMTLPSYFKILVVPHSHPKTKPKACNYGLAHAKGEFIVIYDAEDQPEPDQLKKSYLAFKSSGRDVACLQAKLNYYNPRHNLLTRLFTAEYSLWFDVILPGLQSIKTTIPLGGTSNHFRTQILRDLQGWDPFNVTEDADLGARLFSAGYKTAIVDSTTLEEANSDLKNWFRQRSRWLKGYMQTYLVHMRKPLTLLKKQGWHAFIFQLVIGGKIAFILINPLLWVMTLSYFLLYQYVGPTIESIYPATVFYMALISLLVGNFIALYNYMIGVVKRGHWDLVKYVYLIPLYWLGISYAAAIGFFQLIFKPHYWEKTIHGLHLISAEKKAVRAIKIQKFADLAGNAWQAGGVMVIASLFANIMNFLYNSYLGRHLSLENFGEISLFGSFAYLASVPLSALSRTITHKSGYLLGKYGAPIKTLWNRLKKKSVVYSILIALIWIALTPFLMRFFRVDSYLPFILFAPVWVISTLNALNGGFLSGNLLFIATAITAVIESITKFGVTAIFVDFNYHQYVYAAAPLSLFAVLVFEWWTISRLTNTSSEKEVSESDLVLSSKFYSTSILTSLTKATYLSLDVLLAKHFLTPVEAGAYSYLSLAGKMVFFLSGMFSQFLIPYVSRDLGAGKSSRDSFKKLLILISLVNFGAFLVFGVFGFITAPILWGSQASLIIRYLPAYALAMAFFSTAQVIVTYHQVKGRHLFPLLSFLLALLMGIGMYLEHHSIGEIVLVVAIASVISLGGVLLMTWKYGLVVDLYHAFIDFLGLWKKIPKIEPLPGGKLRILICNWRDLKHKWAGGAEVYLHELAKRWVVMGHELTIFTGNDGHSSRFERVDGVRYVRRGGFYLVYIWAFLYYFFRLRGRYDVIIDSENGLPFFTPLYVREKVFLLIHHVHQEVFRNSLIPPFSWIAAFLEKRVMPLVYKKTEVITVSPSSKADILMHQLTKKEPHIIYNGVDLDKCKPGKKSKVPTVLYLGRLTTAKSVHVLIRAASEIIKNLPRAHFIIAGDGPARGMLTRLVKKIGLESIITFTGKVSEEEKIRLYQQAWVFVNPSLIEGWGITTIEANACGTPVVASNVAGLRDAVKNPHSGLLVPYGNVEEFAATISSLLKNSKTRARMSEESITWAKQFAWDKSATVGENILLGESKKEQYTWINKFNSPGNHGKLMMGTAKYQGQTIFVKEWLTPASSAKNELFSYIELESKLQGVVRIPKLIFQYQEGERLVVGMEYIPGKLASSLTESKKLKVYSQALDTIQNIKLSTSSNLYRRSSFYLLCSFPYIFMKALKVQRDNYIFLLKNALYFLKYSSTLFTGEYGFVHRDLNPDNMLLYKSKIYLIDLQYAAVSLSEYEFAGIWRSIISNKRFANKFISFIKKRYILSKSSRTRFKLLTIYYALLGLTDPKFSKNRVSDFYQILKKVDSL